MKKFLRTLAKGLGFFLVWTVLVSLLPMPDIADPALWRLAAEALPLAVTLLLNGLFWKLEKAPLPLNLWNRPGQAAGIGGLAGALWLGIPVLLLWATGVLTFQGRNAIDLLWVWWLSALLNAGMQELLVRGYLYQLIKRSYSALAAALSTSVLFLLMHGGVFEAGPLAVANVLTMSLLMSLVLEYTRCLIAPVVMHFLWNGIGCLTLGCVSLAEDYPHWLNTQLTGAELVSGGVYALEGSVVVLGMNLALLLAFWLLLRRKAGKTQ